MELLFVCRANLCRSPMAERLAGAALRGAGLAGAVRVGSAGTHAVAGAPMHPAAAYALREAGADERGFTSRPVDARLLAGAGLILTAERAQRAECVRLDPAVLGRTFTLRQFGRLAAAADRLPAGPPQRRLAALLADVGRLRGRLEPGEDDLADPAAGTLAALRACRADISAALRPVLALLTAS